MRDGSLGRQNAVPRVVMARQVDAAPYNSLARDQPWSETIDLMPDVHPRVPSGNADITHMSVLRRSHFGPCGSNTGVETHAKVE